MCKDELNYKAEAFWTAFSTAFFYRLLYPNLHLNLHPVTFQISDFDDWHPFGGMFLDRCVLPANIIAKR